MPWNSNSPNGGLSVKANKTPMLQNTAYIETTMGNTAPDLPYSTSQQDHFWNRADYEGHHRFIKCPPYTDGGSPADPGPDLGTSIGGITYLKTIKGTVQTFFRNVVGIYQVTPAVLRGTKNIPGPVGTYTSIVAVPDDVYGEIFMYTGSGGRYNTVTGFFRSSGGTVESWALENSVENTNSVSGLRFGSGTKASGLNIMATPRNANAGQDWTYIITYRAL